VTSCSRASRRFASSCEPAASISSLSLTPYEANAEEDVELQGLLQRSPQENLEAMLEARDR